MMMYAEHLRLRRYYFLDDDIESFYEYDHRLGHHIMRTSKHTTFKALNFMNIVLENSISNDEKLNDEKNVIDENKVNDWMIDISQLAKNNDLFKQLFAILKNNLRESKNKILDLINKLLINNNDNIALLEMKKYILNDKSKIIGQVGLWNMLGHYEDYQNRLSGEKPNM